MYRGLHLLYSLRLWSHYREYYEKQWLGLVHKIPVLTPKYLLPSLVSPTYSLPLRPEYLSHCSKTWQRTYPICHAPLSKSARCSFVSRRNHRSLACEQKPFAVWFSCWSKGYSVNKSAMGRFLVTFAQKTVDKWPQNSRRFGATTEAFAATYSLTHVSPLSVVLCKIWNHT